MITITLTLTEEEAEKLSETLMFTQDDGPVDEGWQSPVLGALVVKVEDALRIARGITSL